MEEYDVTHTHTMLLHYDEMNTEGRNVGRWVGCVMRMLDFVEMGVDGECWIQIELNVRVVFAGWIGLQVGWV